MKGKRVRQISLLIKEEIARILLSDMSMPDFEFVTITDVDITKDLKRAKVYFSTFSDSGNEKYRMELLKKLKRCRGHLKRELSIRLKLRFTPELTFIYDESLEYARRMSELIDKIQEN